MNDVVRVPLTALLWLVSAAAVAQSSANELLASIAEALEQASYEGTLIRAADGEIVTMHVAHSAADGVVREKLVSMDGEGSEILRNGDELICLLPKRKVKLVDISLASSNAFASLPVVVDELGKFYDLEAQGTERIAGRVARKFFIRPRDAFRFGHRLWVDDETLLPLRMQLVNRRNIVEETRFVEVTIGVDLPASAFTSDIDSSEFRVIRAAPDSGDDPRSAQLQLANQRDSANVESWPPESSRGFRLHTTQSQRVTINGRSAQKLVFSDGIATVSVFITTQPAGEDDVGSKVSRMGAASSYQVRIGEQLLTVVGEVPVETLKMLAEHAAKQISARQQPVRGEPD
ncbi:MAG: MucB/RseB C-terminal domain-containing protein [Pseudomonadota bacterium]